MRAGTFPRVAINLFLFHVYPWLAPRFPTSQIPAGSLQASMSRGPQLTSRPPRLELSENNQIRWVWSVLGNWIERWMLDKNVKSFHSYPFFPNTSLVLQNSMYTKRVIHAYTTLNDLPLLYFDELLSYSKDVFEETFFIATLWRNALGMFSLFHWGVRVRVSSGDHPILTVETTIV